MKIFTAAFVVFAATMPMRAQPVTGDFTIRGLVIGPISVHTELSYEGNGERLVATATNDSQIPVAYVTLCVYAPSRGCLFRLWNTETWNPGVTLSWNIIAIGKTASLEHEVILGETPASSRAKIKTAAPALPLKSVIPEDPDKAPPGLNAKFTIYNLSTGAVSHGWFSKSIWHGAHGKLAARVGSDLYEGEYSGITKGAVGFGSIISGVKSASAISAAVATSGSAVAVLTNGKGDILDCEIEGGSGHGYGGCRQKDGTLYRLIF